MPGGKEAGRGRFTCFLELYWGRDKEGERYEDQDDRV